VGYLHDHPAEHAGPFLAEERRLLESLAEMVAVSLDRRRATERLREVVTTDLVRLWELDVEAGRISWPGIGEPSAPDSPLPLTLTRDQALWAVHPEDRAALSGALEAALADPTGTDKFSADVRVARRPGEYRWRHLVGRVLRDASGRPQRVVGISTDIDRERALLDRIRQGEKMEALGQLAGGVAHDFNNLISLIIGYTHLAADGLPPEAAARRHLEHVIKAGDSATALVKQILAFGRRQALRPQELDLGTAVTQSEALITRLLGSQVEVRTELAPDAPRALVDPTQFQQVLLNLSVNARDAMPRGGRITWRVLGSRCGAPLPDGRTGEPRDWATLEVEDTGTGISPEVRARIFEPFFTTKPEGRGTGLGLATVHGIVTQSGGFLELESEVGRGSLFRVRFPAAGVAAP
jgi:signal transduction histidine kinase